MDRYLSKRGNIFRENISSFRVWPYISSYGLWANRSLSRGEQIESPVNQRSSDFLCFVVYFWIIYYTHNIFSLSLQHEEDSDTNVDAGDYEL